MRTLECLFNKKKSKFFFVVYYLYANLIKNLKHEMPRHIRRISPCTIQIYNKYDNNENKVNIKVTRGYYIDKWMT